MGDASTKENNIIRDKKYNAKLYPIYKMFSCDLIFYYAIKFIFLSQTRGISPATIVLASSIYGLFRVILQVPCTIIIDKLGKRKSLILANIFNSLYIFFLLFAGDLVSLLFAELLCAIAFDIKCVTEPSILTASLPESKKRGSIFSNLEGKGLTGYYALDAIASLASGFLFAINGYLPMILCMCITIFSVYLAYRFKSISTKEETIEAKISVGTTVRNYFKDLKNSFKFIFTSKRLKSLMLFTGVFIGFVCLMDNYEKSLLQELNLPAQYYGIIFAVLTLLSAFAANKQNSIQNKYKNKTLTYISLTYAGACMLAGLIVVINPSFTMSIIVVVIMYAIKYFDNGAYHSLIKRYLGNFSDAQMGSKIYAASYILQNVFRMLIGMLGSFFLSFTSTAYAFTIIGCFFIIAMLAITGYMKTRVGLAPEDYSKKDIEYHVVH